MPKPFRLQRPEPPEHAIQDAVLRYLAYDPRVAWAHRFNTGAVKIPQTDANGRSRGHRFVQFAFKGCSDILGQLVTGHFLAVEVKRPSTKPTPEQAAFLECVDRHGGLAVVARSVEDVTCALDGFFLRAAAEAQQRTPILSGVLEAARPSGQMEHGRQAGGAAGQGARPALELEPETVA